MHSHLLASAIAKDEDAQSESDREEEVSARGVVTIVIVEVFSLLGDDGESKNDSDDECHKSKDKKDVRDGPHF